MKLIQTTLLLAAAAVWFWLAMLLTHEIGHVVAAIATGGRVTYVNLYPGQIPSTLVAPNPSPGIVLWSGILSGWLTPTLVALGWRGTPQSQSALWCWVGFCWLAGGAYLAVGGLEELTDTSQLVNAGWPPALLALMGVVVAIAGYAIFREHARRVLHAVQESPPSGRRVASVCGALLIHVVGQWWLADCVASRLCR